MTQEDIKQIENYRGQYTSNVATELQKIAGKNNGPTQAGCFCKSANVNAYINKFYTWFDNLNETAGQQDEE